MPAALQVRSVLRFIGLLTTTIVACVVYMPLLRYVSCCSSSPLCYISRAGFCFYADWFVRVLFGFSAAVLGNNFVRNITTWTGYHRLLSRCASISKVLHKSHWSWSPFLVLVLYHISIIIIICHKVASQFCGSPLPLLQESINTIDEKLFGI